MDTNYQGQVVYYASGRYRLGIALALALTSVFFVLGIASQRAFLAAALFCLVFTLLFSATARNKLKPGAVALARRGGLLVGLELPRPLLVAETSFEIHTDHEGSWVIVLHNQGSKIRLVTGGWKVEGKSLVTKSVAEGILLSFGLQKQT